MAGNDSRGSEKPHAYVSQGTFIDLPEPEDITGAAITSPYVTMSQNYLKQVNQCWYQIYQIVKENCSVEYGGANPHDDLMEHTLCADIDKRGLNH